MHPLLNSSFLGVLTHDVLVVAAVASGALAATFLACAVILIAGHLLVAAVVLGVRALVQTGVRSLRDRHADQPPAAKDDAGNDHAEVADLERYRQRHQPPPRNNAENTEAFQPDPDDDPA